MQKYEKLKLGLDLGTNSVGWALLDENNRLVKKNGFTFWGGRFFEEANPASGRRGYRTGRRRLDRRSQRITWLREIFAASIHEIDPTFFERLDDSFYKREDKKNNNYYTLFNGDYTDKDFFDKYPTIYHLRRDLVKLNEKFDIRMIYLAIHNIVKYRGNFLMPGEEFKKENNDAIAAYLDNINSAIVELSVRYEDNDEEGYDSDYFVTIDHSRTSFFTDLQDAMKDGIGVTDRQKQLLSVFNVSKKTFVGECIIKLLSGAKCDMSKLQCVKEKGFEKIDINLDSDDIEGKIEEGKSTIGELDLIWDIIPDLKMISDHYYILRIMKDGDSYSDAMCGMYDNHQQELKELKAFVKSYHPEKYNECFRTVKPKLNNYAAYVGRNDTNSKMIRFSHASVNDFYDYLKKNILIGNLDEDGEHLKQYFLNKIETRSLLRRQNSNANGSFPMQIHLAELKKILKNQEAYYPFLTEKSDGLTNSEKIISIFKYRIPYYVGPLNVKSEHAWVSRSNEAIRPWNFDKVVQIDETAERFIRRMQNKCTYLQGESDYCLPKNSIIFSEYNCLAYLNKIQLNGEYISTNIKKDLFENVFLVKKKPTRKDIVEYFESHFGKNSVLGGEKGLPELTASMASYITFKDIFKDDFEAKIDVIEDIIKDVTLFQDKSILESRLINLYNLPLEKVKLIKGLNYQGYSSLSKNLICGIKIVNPTTGEVYGSLLDVMRNTNMNLQEILYHPDYRLIDRIDAYNSSYVPDTNVSLEEFINENINVSPLIKRPIIQSIKIIDEIEKIFGQKIDEFYIECTRTNKAVRKKTKSRYEEIKDLYASIGKTIQDVNMKELSNELEEYKDSLKSDMLYLYFTQLGRCMYSLNKININDLFTNNLYDIDHIYPQSVIKDDSLSNRVLTLKTINNDVKKDKFLFETDAKAKDADKFYAMLLNKKLISSEKFRRLTIKELNEKELDKFVNRQIVVTNQSVKGLIEVLKQYKNVPLENIIYSKGENISDFRNDFDLYKSRTANNFHHAHDAYLNVIIGGIIHKYFTKNRYANVFKDYERMKAEGVSINLSKIFAKDYVYARGQLLWDKAKMIKQIKHDLYERFDVNETFRTYNSHEMFSQVTVMPASDGKLVPFKTTNPRSNTIKYGGIKQPSYSRYVIVKTYDKKGNEQCILEAIPRTSIPSLINEKENRIAIDKYLSTIYDKFKVEHYNIKINVLVCEEDKRYVITGKTNDSYFIKNVLDRFFYYESIKVIKKLDKYVAQLKAGVSMSHDDNSILVAVAKNDKCKEIRIYREELIALLNKIVEMYKKKIYKYSVIQKVLNAVESHFNEIKSFEIKTLIYLTTELLQLLKTNVRQSADLTAIGESKQSASLTIGKALHKGMKFISESVTGYYSKVIYEVK